MLLVESLKQKKNQNQKQQEEQTKTLNMEKLKIIKWTVIGILAVVLFLVVNPFAWNDAGYRTVVTQSDGHQFVQFEPGIYYQGLFAKSQVWPNQLSVSYREDQPDIDLVDNTIEIGKVTVRFAGDASTAKMSGIVQYILPSSEKEMLVMHNVHKSPEALVQRRLDPYTKECLQSSAQLMSSEMHYSGGRAQMAQDYLDQLKNGVFLLQTKENVVYDTLEKTEKRSYDIKILETAPGQAKRKFSSIKEYGITVADAQITDTDYEDQVDKMLAKKIAASTSASVAKQELLTAQQRQLTAEAQGKEKLVRVEYEKKVGQTQQIVEAETKIEIARRDLEAQEIARQAAEKEAAKIKTLADAEAYAKAKVMQADGALDKKLDAYVKVMSAAWEAIAQYQGDWVPRIVYGSSNGSVSYNGAEGFMQVLAARTMSDLAVDLKAKK